MNEHADADFSAVRRFHDGASEAFGELYDRYAEGIFRFVYAKTRHRETAEDLTSHVFIKALEHLPSFKSDLGGFRAWLYRIARNTIIDHYRTNRATSDIEDAWDIAGNSDTAKEAEAQITLRKVEKYLKDLTAEQRDVVFLRLWQDLSYAEIAQILGKSEASCKMMFSRVLSKIRKDVLVMLLAGFMNVIN